MKAAFGCRLSRCRKGLPESESSLLDEDVEACKSSLSCEGVGEGGLLTVLLLPPIPNARVNVHRDVLGACLPVGVTA